MNSSNYDLSTIATRNAFTPTATIYGQTAVTTAGTRVALGASVTLFQGLTIRAHLANTGTIYVGDSSVSSTTGYMLSAGESVFVPISNRATIYIDSSVDGEGVSYIGG